MSPEPASSAAAVPTSADADDVEELEDVRQRAQAPARTKWWLHIGLFVATCASTTFAGAVNGGSWRAGAIFAATLMTILPAHEMGHSILARRHKVDVSLPFFIPLPIGIGTMGAVIKMRGRIPSRDALVDIGAAGPLAGLLVAVPLLIMGVALSPMGVSPPGGIQEGNSLLYVAIKLVLKGFYLPSGGVDVQLHPMAFAAWVGILVTFINLLPIGQLDGGHVAYGWLGHQRHDRFSAWLHRMLLAIGVVVAGALTLLAHRDGHSWGASAQHGAESALPWAVWTLMIYVMRRMAGGVYHPPVSGEILHPRQRRIAILILVVLVLIFTPVPMREVLP